VGQIGLGGCPRQSVWQGGTGQVMNDGKGERARDRETALKLIGLAGLKHWTAGLATDCATVSEDERKRGKKAGKANRAQLDASRGVHRLGRCGSYGRHPASPAGRQACLVLVSDFTRDGPAPDPAAIEFGNGPR
jgi:hypothetical protein